ncbi:ATP-binding protein [Nonomuraea sp. NPDC052116]|uniref:ATP-binding protein n=1 Tax=Nonomuraea sp. NPDC052116 TaxID=3155665 RepID=UPI0034220A72
MQVGNYPGDDPDEQLRRHLENSIAGFIPPRFRAEIELPKPAVEWAANGHNAGGLYLTGPVGVGKTHTAYAALAAWCRATNTTPFMAGYDHNYGVTNRYGPTVHVVRATTLLDQLRPGADGAREIVSDCQRARLLYIDDMGAEKPSEWTQERLYEVIDERYVACRPLIVTSNLPPKSLADHVGERTASRLAEMCELVPLTGSDRRRPQ